MSNFTFYRSTGFTLKRMRNIRRGLAGACIALWLFIQLCAPLSKEDSPLSVFLISTIILFVLLGALMVFNIISNSKLMRLGVLGIYKNKITKSIKGIKESFIYDELRTITIKRHMNTIFPLIFTGKLTYLVTINCKDGKSETFVLNSMSAEKPKVNFIDTLKKAKELLHADFSIQT